jgi:hypothetical protein
VSRITRRDPAARAGGGERDRRQAIEITRPAIDARRRELVLDLDDR